MWSGSAQEDNFSVKNQADAHGLIRRLCINDDYADNGLCAAGHKPFCCRLANRSGDSERMLVGEE